MAIYAKDFLGETLLLFLITFILYVLFSKDALIAINNADGGRDFIQSIAKIISSIPGLLFGLLAFGAGVGIVIWILYNYLIEKQPGFWWNRYIHRLWYWSNAHIFWIC